MLALEKAHLLVDILIDGRHCMLSEYSVIMEVHVIVLPRRRNTLDLACDI